ncbi:hypothetical protein COU54_03575 [Candidatus Pacearchaeota archaeon CG10_big_fil_rev_8_21_14_0_10_31_24]|nr:MAG: hypothetical protein COU54_03575 [Candidatus Pacearchaeota archaeon CG10_big_fil_rev_8_21_14_0_10_31_24]
MSSTWAIIGLIIGIVFFVIKLASKKQEVAVKIVLFGFIFLMLTIGYVYVTYDADISTYDGTVAAVKVYGIWLKNAFSNAGSVTGYAFNQNWDIDPTLGNITLGK